jgi:hypothetical protein
MGCSKWSLQLSDLGQLKEWELKTVHCLPEHFEQFWPKLILPLGTYYKIYRIKLNISP